MNADGWQSGAGHQWRTRVVLAEVGEELGGKAVRVVRDVDETCAQAEVQDRDGEFQDRDRDRELEDRAADVTTVLTTAPRAFAQQLTAARRALIEVTSQGRH